MGKTMADVIENITQDTSWEHSQHSTMERHCPSCFTENLVINSRKPCPAGVNCMGDGTNYTEARYCDPCHRYAESFDIGI